MAWDKTKPENDMLLINFPPACRANWDAIELGTDPSLLITNDKVSPSAGIVDTKLAQITTPNKVHGSALTGLASVPSGAGVLPAVNSPNKLKADASDTTPEYLDSLIDSNMFQVSAGDQLQLKDGGVQTQKLEGGVSAPGNNKAYGTNNGGTKGFFDVVDLATNQILTGQKTLNNLKLGGNADCDKKQLVSAAIENRTFDPDTPVTGQIWFRTDV
ncbi:MAG: hypothetical protein JW847_02360 [Candidatus Omnitrophica bacterium]|nr:hypothetical protein [Candidatus Omnitrophota bacterium]